MILKISFSACSEIAIASSLASYPSFAILLPALINFLKIDLSSAVMKNSLRDIALELSLKNSLSNYQNQLSNL